MRTNFDAVRTILLAGLILLLGALPAQAEEYEGLQGVNSITTVFDVRAGTPKSAAIQLDLILQTFSDDNIRAADEQPEFVVVFIGPAVKLVSTDVKGFPPEEQEYIEQIESTVKEMARQGIKLEICIFAAEVMGVDPATILPTIKHVRNGWISLIGYQARGYSLVPAY
ncbi:MAG TPA: sulfur reduction protein DsrE [Desulfobacteraceae bacterium]|nr:sulfur reduction protein DsrE [Desulfobacteraceae bacterium]